MRISLSPELKIIYPRPVFGSLIAKQIPNKRNDASLEEVKREIEKNIRAARINIDQDSIIQTYNNFFKKEGKTYPIEFQLKTIKGGGKFPLVSVLVDCMFIAEVKNRILTSGHDLDVIQGDLVFDVSDGGERFLKLNDKDQVLKENDVLLRDEQGILATVLYGPGKRTSITSETRNALYLAWCPYRIDEGLIASHLKDVHSDLSLIYKNILSEIRIHR